MCNHSVHLRVWGQVCIATPACPQAAASQLRDRLDDALAPDMTDVAYLKVSLLPSKTNRGA